MPREIKQYGCDWCPKVYGTFDEAKRCSDNGLYLPEYFQYDIVRTRMPDAPAMSKIGIVLQDNFDSECGESVHNPTLSYFVLGQPGRASVFNNDYNRDNIEPELIDGYCPICKSINLLSITENLFQITRKMPRLRLETITLSQCSICNAKFFTHEQSAMVRKQIAEFLKSRGIPFKKRTTEVIPSTGC